MSETIRPSTDHCILAGIAGSKQFAKLSGTELDITRDQFIDDQHLLPVWYGGYIGSMKLPDGWQIIIETAGIIDMTVHLDDGDAEYENKDNTDARGSDLLSRVDDAQLRALDKDGRVEWRNNNWMEYNFVDPKGRRVDCGVFSDNIIEDADVLSVFYHDSQLALVEALNKFKARYDINTGTINPEV